jgi:hypothetical protein
MKKLDSYLKKKNIYKATVIDDKSILFLFGNIIKEEYGKKGSQSLTGKYIKDKKIFVKAENSNWANEFLINKAAIIRKMNNDLGGSEIKDIVLE